MKEVLSILFGAGFTAGVSLALGSLLFRWLRIRLYRIEATIFAFVAGSGVLSLLVTLLCITQVARKGVFLWGGIAAIAAAIVMCNLPGKKFKSSNAHRLLQTSVNKG